MADESSEQGNLGKLEHKDCKHLKKKNSWWCLCYCFLVWFLYSSSAFNPRTYNSINVVLTCLLQFPHHGFEVSAHPVDLHLRSNIKCGHPKWNHKEVSPVQLTLLILPQHTNSESLFNRRTFFFFINVESSYSPKRWSLMASFVFYSPGWLYFAFITVLFPLFCLFHSYLSLNHIKLFCYKLM